jgi:tetratricopeptide (TPR) repeat protein
LQTYISRLRRTFGDSPALVLEPAGYRLDLTGHDVDLQRFEQRGAEGEALLAAGKPGEARDALAEALELWRGPALPELADHRTGVARAAALEERRLVLLEERIDTDLALGRHAHLTGELQALVADHPLREGLHAKLALALYRCGRQADALRALAAAATTLREELGLEPGVRLTELEAAILAHDPVLDQPSTALVEPASPVSPPAPPGVPALGTADEPIPLVGRQAELAELLAAYDEAVDDARFVVVEGEPGIGKTRLVEELLAGATARHSLAVWGRSNEGGAAPALWPWLPVLRAATALALDAVPEPLVDVLEGGSPLVAGQGAAVQFERFDAIGDILERAGKERPLVVCLDDLQWADPASLALLEFLATRLNRGVLIVATLRTLEVGKVGAVTHTLAALARRHGSRRMRLRGLVPAGTDALLTAIARGDVPPDLSSRIHDRAEGNPFYAIELARLLAGGAGDGEVPASVRDAIRRRLGQLPDDTVELLTVAAVAGRDLEVPVVARAAGLDPADCLERLDPAAEHRLLEASPQGPVALRFSHALVREVLVEDLTPLRRARLHLRIADAMAEAAGSDEAVDRDLSEVLAGHLAEAVPLGVGARAAVALERAAETAISRVAYAQAEELLGRAAQLRRVVGSGGAGPGRSPTDAKRAELATLLRLLEVMQATRYFSGTDRDVLRRAQELAAELGDEDVVRKMAWYDWASLSTADRLAECRPMAEAYLARWGPDLRPSVSAAAHVLMGVDEWTRGRIDAALRHLDAALALLEGQPPPADAFEGEYRVIAHAFSLYSRAAAGSISPEEALGGFAMLLSVVPPAAVPAVCAFAGAVAACHRRWEDLDRLVRRALDADPSAQFAFFGGQLLMQRAVVLAAAGELDAAVATFADGRSRYRAVGGRATTATYQALLGELLARAGRGSEAVELVSGARRHFDDVGGGSDEVTLLVAEGVIAALAGDQGRSRQRLAAAVEVGDRNGAHALARRAEQVAAELSVLPPG